MKYSLSAKNLVNRNLEARANYCAGLMSVDGTREITGVLRADSGLLSHTFNQVVTTAVMPSRILQRFAVDYFRERHSPFTLWHCANKPLDEGEMAELGLRRQPSMVAMAGERVHLAAVDDLPEDLKGKLQLEPLDAEALDAYGQLQAQAYSGEREGPQIRKFYQALARVPEAKRCRLRYFAGRLDGKVVAGASLYASADALGCYELFVDENYRGRGIGRALFHYLVGQIQKGHHKHAVALTSADRQQLLLEAGFFAVGEVACYRFEP
ncbi:hypothetical protein Maes01_00927 [Microbulbifer aestuariivivens]|uniref:N-acetyltransferase domain-containing protein n=1 Tax=Microbulbifer aestuariivivens TaxID=1908308 RepID=A0ABP9WMP1_9GAMM